MPLPIDLIFIRHGESEGNAAMSRSQDGDDSLLTPEFRNRHSREFRLTKKGQTQAVSAGAWLSRNMRTYSQKPFYYVSDYIRAMETAYLLDIPSAEWRVEFHLRERDMALMDNITHSEKLKFVNERRQHELNPFYSIPAGGGESLAGQCLRVKATFIEHIARQRSDNVVYAVCHGHTMRALQVEIENLGHDDFMRLSKSKNPADKIRNCQILWYSRLDPETLQLNDKVVAVRSICPWDSEGDYGWRRIERKLFSNQDLANLVERSPKIINE